MNYIYDLINGIYEKIKYVYSAKPSTTPINIIHKEDILYIFINCENIKNATDEFMNDIIDNKYNNKYINIYLLKSHILKRIFIGVTAFILNDEYILNISNILKKQKKQPHTFIDGIHSFIELNGIKNYVIYY